jgi:hypothetical protein
MAILHASLGKSKKRKPTAKQRELQAEWEKLLKKYDTKPVAKLVKPIKQVKEYIRETPKYPSLDTGYHDCTKKPTPVYTGTAIKGIGTMHKSNAVPIFSDEQAIEIATMRRN